MTNLSRTVTLLIFVIFQLMTPRSAEASSGIELLLACSRADTAEQFDLADRYCSQGLEAKWFAEPIYYNGVRIFEGIALKDSYAFGDLYLLRGRVRRKLGRYRDAFDDLTAATKFSNGAAGAYFERGLLLEELGYRERARKDFSKAYELFPGMPIARKKYKEYGLLTGACWLASILC